MSKKRKLPNVTDYHRKIARIIQRRVEICTKAAVKKALKGTDSDPVFSFKWNGLDLLLAVAFPIGQIIPETAKATRKPKKSTR